ncbi:TIR domain-containing protein [Paenisporosarcina quisquiliarum]|uniref:TIR domain-containing protein n=1 Tax=Paenisporosarcina quisquiliarum TaxID=365346 RepID=UPI0037352893
MNFERKKDLINQLLNELNELEYNQDTSDRESFMRKGEVTLRAILGDSSHQVVEFKNVRFSPSILSIGGDNTDAYLKGFNRGKGNIKAILNGVLHEVVLQDEINLSTLENANSNEKEKLKSNKVFIVHGHDDGLKSEVGRFVEKLGFEAIILHEQASGGGTIIEKIERYSDVGFAIVLYTPCDEGKAKLADTLRDRARQNVVFEHGYFISKLGRSNVVALHKGDDIELPNDISGVIYIKYEGGNWKFEIAQEMDDCGYEINYRKLK